MSSLTKNKTKTLASHLYKKYLFSLIPFVVSL